MVSCYPTNGIQKVFNDNLHRQTVSLTDSKLLDLCVRSAQNFETLKLFHRGESSEIRCTGHRGLLVQKLLPSLNSISSQRKGDIEGTAGLRLDISQALWSTIHLTGLSSCHLARYENYILITEEIIPPVEVIIKSSLTGTPARIYHGLLNKHDRFGNRFEYDKLHSPYVRFDYRNPLYDHAGTSLRDECLPLGLAERLIDSTAATAYALKTFTVISDFFDQLQLTVLDMCLILNEQGNVLCYELSPDNMRIKSNPDNSSGLMNDFDKDLWRKGHDAETIVQYWIDLRDRISGLPATTANSE